MTPEALRRRMAHGNIYQPEKVDAALGNYFRVGNLSALRELALLWVADKVDAGLQDYMESHGIEATWETRERVVVAVTGAPSGEHLIRRAARMAQRSKADLIGVHVQATDGLADNSDGLLDAHRQLLVDLGGTYHEVVGSDVAKALTQFARSEHATQVVLGATRRSRLSELTSGSVINAVLRESGHLDVHVISDEEPSAAAAAVWGSSIVRRRRLPHLSPRRQAAGWLLTLFGITAADAGPRPGPGHAQPADRHAAVPRARRGGGHGRRAVAGSGGGRGGVAVGELVLHRADPHVHHRRGREPDRAHHVPGGGDPGQRAGDPGVAAIGRCAAGPHRGRGAGPRGRRPGRRRRRGGRDGRPPPHDVRPRHGHPAGARCHRPVRVAGRGIGRQPDADHADGPPDAAARRRRGARARRPACSTPRTSSCSTSSRRSSAPRSSGGGSRPRPARPRRWPRPTSCAPPSCGPSRTTCARRSPRSRPRPRACCSRTSTGPRRPSRSSSPPSTRSPTGSTTWSATCST